MVYYIDNGEGKGAPAMSEREYEEMTKDEMQRFIDQQMGDGRSWEDALKRLAEVIGIKPTDTKE